LLTQLQPQLDQKDDIYILDVSKQRDALKIAKLYGSSRCLILVEPGNYTTEEGLKYAEEFANKNGHKQMMFLPDNSVISTTLIPNFKRGIKLAEMHKPQIIESPYPNMPSEFRWYNADLKDEIIVRLPNNLK
jgi:hypothetical protein